MIINLPATVEMTTPNVLADEVEYGPTTSYRVTPWCSPGIRTTMRAATAATELAELLPTARLLGNGERTGNVDLSRLTMDLMDRQRASIRRSTDCADRRPTFRKIRKTVEYCNQIKISERHPYAGNFVFTAFSGSHFSPSRRVLRPVRWPPTVLARSEASV